MSKLGITAYLLLDEDDSGFVPPEGRDEDEGSPCAEDEDTAEGGSSDGFDDAEDGTASAGLEGDSEDEFDESSEGEGIKEDPCDDGCGCTQAPTGSSLTWAALIGLLAIGRRRR